MVNQTKFNMSSATLERLDELLRKSITAYDSGDSKRLFFLLKNLKLQCMFKFLPRERKKMARYEKMFFLTDNPGVKWAIAEKYLEQLLDFMDKYGLLLPDKINDIDTVY